MPLYMTAFYHFFGHLLSSVDMMHHLCRKRQTVIIFDCVVWTLVWHLLLSKQSEVNECSSYWMIVGYNGGMLVHNSVAEWFIQLSVDFVIVELTDRGAWTFVQDGERVRLPGSSSEDFSNFVIPSGD